MARREKQQVVPLAVQQLQMHSALPQLRRNPVQEREPEEVSVDEKARVLRDERLEIQDVHVATTA